MVVDLIQVDVQPWARARAYTRVWIRIPVPHLETNLPKISNAQLASPTPSPNPSPSLSHFPNLDSKVWVPLSPPLPPFDPPPSSLSRLSLQTLASLRESPFPPLSPVRAHPLAPPPPPRFAPVLAIAIAIAIAPSPLASAYPTPSSPSPPTNIPLGYLHSTISDQAVLPLSSQAHRHPHLDLDRPRLYCMLKGP